MNYTSISSLFVALFMPFFGCLGQDIHFAQTSLIPQLINPASTGVFDGWERVTLSHRQQWVSLGSPYVTSQFSADMNLFKDKNNSKAHLGLGIFFFNDVAGDANMGISQFGLSVSGIVPVTKTSSLSVGIQTSGAQRKIDPQNLSWGNQFSGDGFDSNLPSNESNFLTSYLYPDFVTGVFYTTSLLKNKLVRKEKIKIQTGFSYHHFTQPQLKFRSGTSDKLSTKILYQLNAHIDIPNTKFAITPSFLYAFQNKQQEILYSLAIKYRLKNSSRYTGIYVDSYLSGGIIIRSKDAISPHLFIEFKSYKIGLNYEIALSGLNALKANTFEISFQWANMNDALFKTRRTKGFKKVGGGM